jgi:hypothetical protein
MATDLLSTIRKEIDERLNELRPLMAEYEQLLGAAGALVLTGADKRSASPAANRPQAPARGKPPAARRPAPRRGAAKPKSGSRSTVRGAAREAILGALEHGSHTVGELAVVTAMSSASINGNLRRLAVEGVVVKTEREGKTAWSLADNDDRQPLVAYTASGMNITSPACAR